MHFGAILGAKMEPRSHEKGIKKVVLKRLENDAKNKKKIKTARLPWSPPGRDPTFLKLKLYWRK